MKRLLSFFSPFVAGTDSILQVTSYERMFNTGCRLLILRQTTTLFAKHALPELLHGYSGALH
jgi:hypothetical protein